MHHYEDLRKSPDSGSQMVQCLACWKYLDDIVAWNYHYCLAQAIADEGVSKSG